MIGAFVNMQNNTGDRDIWIIARQRDGIIQRVSFELLARARELIQTDFISSVCFSSEPDVRSDEETCSQEKADAETDFHMAARSTNRSEFGSADDTTVLSIMSDEEIRFARSKKKYLLKTSSNKDLFSSDLKVDGMGKGGQVNAILLAPELPDSELMKLIHYGADQVFVLESPEFTEFIPDLQAEALCSFIREHSPEIVLSVADSVGRTLAPYCAMRLHTGLTADCTYLALDPETGHLLQTRPAIGGNIMATIQCAGHRPQMATVRPHSFRPMIPDQTRKGPICRLSAVTDHYSVRMTVQRLPNGGEELSIQDVERIVVVGRGLRSPENLPAIFQFAKMINAAVGATREAVDRGWLPYACQIGLSGKTVTPKLYIGLGVSGAVQHLAGMQTSGTIVAVNKDPEAQIFKAADFGIVGDLMEVLPALTDQFKMGIMIQ